jgi:Putative membrane protein insertion efficiency factor
MNIATLLLNVYTSYITRLTPPLCNYKYTCSQYCIDCIKQHGIINGTILTRRRLKSCKADGIKLRSEFKIKTKHFCSGSTVTRYFEPITIAEKLSFFNLILNLIIIGSLLILALIYCAQGLAIGFGIAYFLILIFKLISEQKQKTITLNWTLMTIALLPMLIFSFPSMLIGSLVNSVFHSSQISNGTNGYQNATNKDILLNILLVITVGAIFINSTFASILLIAFLLLTIPIKFSNKDRVLDNYSILWSMFAAIVSLFNPIYSLVFVALWWKTKINIV